MSEELNRDRRALFGAAAAMTIVGAQVGLSGLARAATGDTKAGALPGVKPGTHTSFATIKQINAGLLNVGYAEDGPADGPAVVLLHGWPYDIHSYVDVAPLLASKGYHVIVPYLRGYGTTRFLSGDTFRNAQQSAVGLDIIALMDALKIQTATVAGFDWGARTADVMATLWPERCKGIVSVGGYLISSPAGNQTPLPPEPAFLFGTSTISLPRSVRPAMRSTSISSTSSSGARLRQSGISTMLRTTAQQRPSTTPTTLTS